MRETPTVNELSSFIEWALGGKAPQLAGSKSKVEPNNTLVMLQRPLSTALGTPLHFGHGRGGLLCPSTTLPRVQSGRHESNWTLSVDSFADPGLLAGCAVGSAQIVGRYPSGFQWSLGTQNVQGQEPDIVTRCQ